MREEGGYLVPERYLYKHTSIRQVYRNGTLARIMRYAGGKVGVFGMKLGQKIFDLGMKKKTVEVDGLLDWLREVKKIS